MDTVSGTYTGDKVHLVSEDVLDLGNCKFEVYQLPASQDASILIYDREHGLCSSDIYGVNRYWVADQFGAKGVRQDLLLSLHQQLMAAYTKDGRQVRSCTPDITGLALEAII